jgi:hypothetical protein
MDYPGIPSSHSRLVSIGLAYAAFLFISVRIAMILESRMRGSYYVGFVVAVIAVAVVLVGNALLMRTILRHMPSKPGGKSSDQTSRGSGVWDQQLDG